MTCKECFIYVCVPIPEGGRKQKVKNPKHFDPTAPTETKEPIEKCKVRILYKKVKEAQ